MPRQVFTAGEILTAADMNDLSDQTVMTFAGTAARGSAIPSPVEGMAAYIADQNLVQLYDGSAWKNSLGVTGGILQVVSTFKDDPFTVTSTSFSDVTGLTASITPSSTSSKVLVMVTMNTAADNTVVQIHGNLLRGATVIGVGAAASSRTRAWLDTASVNQTSNNIIYLDSPNTTSSTVYKVQVRGNTANPVYVNRRLVDTDSAIVGRTASTITLMEVAG
jgi:hypothetical protein